MERKEKKNYYVDGMCSVCHTVTVLFDVKRLYYALRGIVMEHTVFFLYTYGTVGYYFWRTELRIILIREILHH